MFDWTQSLSAEDNPGVAGSYLVPAAMEELFFAVTNSEASLNFVVGFQGVGKTTGAAELADRLRKAGVGVVFLKWKESGNLRRVLFDALFPPPLGDELEDDLFDLFRRQARSDPLYARRLSARIEEREFTHDQYCTIEHITGSWPRGTDWLPEFRYVYDLLPAAGRELLEKDAIEFLLRDGTCVVIDSPDYPKHDRRLINGDLDEFSAVWQWLNSTGWKGHVAFFAQQETFGTHFVQGKGHVYELKPFGAQTLVDYFWDTFGDLWPFEDEALLRLARLSRGIMRRYKKYVGTCLSRWAADKKRPRLVSADLVRSSITIEELARDMELDLGRIFTKEEPRRNAVRVFWYLAGNDGGVNQTTLSRELGLEQMALSRLLGPLESAGYILRRNQKGGKVVFLA